MRGFGGPEGDYYSYVRPAIFQGVASNSLAVSLLEPHYYDAHMCTHTCKAVGGGLRPPCQTHFLSTAPTRVVTTAAVRPHTESGTVAPIVVGQALNSEAEPYPGVAVISGEGLDGGERGGRGKCHISINIIHVVVKGNILICHLDVELKPSLRI